MKKFKSLKNNSFGESFESNFSLGDLVMWTEIKYSAWGPRNLEHHGTIVSIFEEKKGNRSVKKAKIMLFGSGGFKNVLLTNLKKINEQEN
tara:strand:- start:48 stop:317 length:270 start_codon:yes stop_codon:yes gene_type:complete